MTGETNLSNLLSSMSPTLSSEEFIFCTFPNTSYADHHHLSPIASFQEVEGLTLVIPKRQADQNIIAYESVFNCITLKIHSSLDAVGLTAAFTTKLAQHNLSANVFAGYYHDHIFIQKEHAQKALAALKELTNT